MMKKAVSLFLASVMCMSMATTVFAEETATEDGAYKIAVITGTTSQGEEEFRAAERAAAEYPGIVVTDTYPDNFSSETEATISKIISYASDPEVKAIIMCQAVPGTKAAYDKVRNELGRDDILLIAGVPQEDPAVIGEASDIVLYSNEAAQGDTIIETCANWGCEVFVHYSFPRHLAIETIAARKAVLEANCEMLGIEYVEATAPDPTSDAGVSGAQQFILEDVPAKMEEYAGKKVAFFSTNCAMQESLQTAVLAEENAYYPQPCCPSPYHAFPASLGLEIAVGGDDTEALQAIAAKLAEYDAVGRFSTWPSPVNMIIIDVAVDYAKAWIEGEITERCDGEALTAMFQEACEGATVSVYTNADGSTVDNYYTVLLAPVDFNDYL